MAKNIYPFVTVIHPENERAFINLLYKHAPECYGDVITSPLIGLLDPPLAELAMVKFAWADKLEIEVDDDLMTLWCRDQDEEDTMADALHWCEANLPTTKVLSLAQVYGEFGSKKKYDRMTRFDKQWNEALTELAAMQEQETTTAA
jgi:hypothetical protein